MTAEVAVMNRQAVALAADSAVTVRTSRGRTKSWPSVTKIFALPEPHSVALMIYGSTSLHQLPWETVIKNFARTLPNNQYRRLRDYQTAFLRYVRGRRALYPKDEQHTYVFTKLVLEFVDLRTDIEEAIGAALAASSNQQLTPAEQRQAITLVLDHWQEELRAAPRLRRLPKNFRSRFASEYRTEMRNAKKGVFQDMPLTAAQSRRITTIAHLMFERTWLMEGYSGVVFAGYGLDDLFPSLEHVRIEGFALDYLIVTHDPDAGSIDRSNGATVRAFAQGDDVYAFMEGVQPRYQRELERIMFERMIEVPQDLVAGLTMSAARRKKLTAQVLDFTTDQYGSAMSELFDFRRNQFSRPVVHVVSALPVDELAVMAETLVNLTSFRQKVSMSVETVGGPVDVAVISKGDGFVWIKRKNYYDINQNPRVLARYFT